MDVIERKIKPMALETTLIIERLLKLAPGETVLYPELDAIIGMPVNRGQGYGYAMTARNRLLRDNDILVVPVDGVGLHRCTPEEKVAVVEKDISYHGNSVRRMEVKSSAMTEEEYSGLSQSSRQRVDYQRTTINVYKHFSKPKTLEAVKQLAASESKPVPVAKLLEDTIKHFGKGR